MSKLSVDKCLTLLKVYLLAKTETEAWERLVALARIGETQEERERERQIKVKQFAKDMEIWAKEEAERQKNSPCPRCVPDGYGHMPYCRQPLDDYVSGLKNEIAELKRRLGE